MTPEQERFRDAVVVAGGAVVVLADAAGGSDVYLRIGTMHVPPACAAALQPTAAALVRFGRPSAADPSATDPSATGDAEERSVRSFPVIAVWRDTGGVLDALDLESPSEGARRLSGGFTETDAAVARLDPGASDVVVLWYEMRSARLGWPREGQVAGAVRQGLRLAAGLRAGASRGGWPTWVQPRERTPGCARGAAGMG